MKIVFLRSAANDALWFRAYYTSVFPEGAKNARERLLKTKSLLLANPQLGHPVEEDGIRELPIVRTPFSLIYRIAAGQIEVIRLWDQRAERPSKWIDKFSQPN